MDTHQANFNLVRNERKLTIMRNTRSIRTPAPARLTDDEIAQHIKAAYSAINATLFNASRADAANFGFQQGARYVLSLNADSAIRGTGTLLDRRENRSHQIKVCFGSSVSDVQLFREYFEDVDNSNHSPVRVKSLSQPSLFRSFLAFLKSMQSSDRVVYRSFGVHAENRIGVVA
jgi:hypothetical protein